ncbi:EthD domain-containing protein [Mycobacterium sp.]|uniref:EthD domain-containing protein n=1 Tax=Mycobacterium sp. TaxID=1785 RepID=UPI002D1CC549|nr:EthD domain-containing protein [Mycobacterium sp.]HKP42744.1 EthD domain-containing protein [Mycobacterium sp.]
MYFVSVMYPRTSSGWFDLGYYLRVHAPLGIGLLWKHFQVKPITLEVHTDTFGVDRTEASAPYAVISTVTFATRADAECFIDLFERPREAAVLSSDWPNFTEGRPVVVLGAVSQLDVDDVIEQSHTIIETAFAAPEKG